MSKAKELKKQRVKKRYRQKRTMKRIEGAILSSRQYNGALMGNHQLNTIIRDEAAYIDSEEWKKWEKMILERKDISTGVSIIE